MPFKSLSETVPLLNKYFFACIAPRFGTVQHYVAQAFAMDLREGGFDLLKQLCMHGRLSYYASNRYGAR
ncbi:MAG TPA: hypothetical protein PLO62_06620 [Candidatus Hydrogenedentes bacterium]|nr:hypothetical protein [Candidatus Hydrogenedentota bacterium]HOS03522.1 hypothetical protein [Candidatus Hydrogenedentota bacterium]